MAFELLLLLFFYLEEQPKAPKEAADYDQAIAATGV